jgi:DNA-binding NtrC family response regulator
MHLEPATIIERARDDRVEARIGPPAEGGIEIGGYELEHADRPSHAAEPIDAREDGIVVFRAGMTIDDMERQAIRAALAEVGGNRRKAAELLGIGERTLYRKIAKYDLESSS